MSGKPDPAVELLYDNLHALPDEDGSKLNYLPFAYESDTAKALKRTMSKAIVSLLRGAGYMVDHTAPSEPPPLTRDVSVHCRSCGELLLKTHVMADGRANVPAASIISGFAQREAECPHKVVTPEMQRQRIQDAVKAAQAQEQS